MDHVLEVKLPFSFKHPETGEEIDSAVIGLMKVRDRIDISKKFPNPAKAYDDMVLYALQRRLIRLGSLDSPVPREILLEMPTSNLDYLVDAMAALDMGFDSVEAYRESDKYPGNA